MRLIEPKTVLISGASAGIGASLAEIYADTDRTLILTGRNSERLESVAKKCQAKHARVIHHAFDISERTVLINWLNEILQNYQIDLVIANAGISIGSNPGSNHESLDRLNHLFDVNLKGVINTIHPIMQQMQQRKTGQIAIMSSIASYRGYPQSPSYSASKAAVKIYGQGIRALLRKDGVSVSIIYPGFVKTAMSEKLKGPKPLMITSERAAKIIKTKLAKNTAQIIFPRSLALSAKLLNILPQRFGDKLLMRVRSFVDEPL